MSIAREVNCRFFATIANNGEFQLTYDALCEIIESEFNSRVFKGKVYRNQIQRDIQFNNASMSPDVLRVEVLVPNHKAGQKILEEKFKAYPGLLVEKVYTRKTPVSQNVGEKKTHNCTKPYCGVGAWRCNDCK